MLNFAKVAQQVLHVVTPLVQDVIRASWLGEADNPGRTVNPGVDHLRGNELADILLRLDLGQVEVLCQPVHSDAGVVFGDNADIVLDDPLAQVLPSLVGFGVRGGAKLGVKDVRLAEMRSVELLDVGPSHKLLHCELLEQLSLKGDLRVAGVRLNAVHQVVLLVVMSRKDGEVDDTRQGLYKIHQYRLSIKVWDTE